MGFEADYGGAKGAMTAGSEHLGRAYAMQSLPLSRLSKTATLVCKAPVYWYRYISTRTIMTKGYWSTIFLRCPTVSVQNITYLSGGAYL